MDESNLSFGFSCLRPNRPFQFAPNVWFLQSSNSLNGGNGFMYKKEDEMILFNVPDFRKKNEREYFTGLINFCDARLTKLILIDEISTLDNDEQQSLPSKVAALEKECSELELVATGGNLSRDANLMLAKKSLQHNEFPELIFYKVEGSVVAVYVKDSGVVFFSNKFKPNGENNSFAISLVNPTSKRYLKLVVDEISKLDGISALVFSVGDASDGCIYNRDDIYEKLKQLLSKL